MFPYYYVIHQDEDDGMWLIEVFEKEGDTFKGIVECETIQDVARAITDVSDDATDLHVSPEVN